MRAEDMKVLKEAALTAAQQETSSFASTEQGPKNY